MDIAVTTILCSLYLEVLLFLGHARFCQHRSFIYCNCPVFTVMGSDHIYHHAEDERRSREFFIVGSTAFHSCGKYHE